MSNQLLSVSGNNANVCVFWPPSWSEIDRFVDFHSTTYQFKQPIEAALSGISGHWHKAEIMIELARSSAPDLKKDREQERSKGYSNNSNGARLAAIVETVFCELYSSVDCARQVVGQIFTDKKFRGIPDSTRKFFQYADEGKLDTRLPEPIRNAFLQADWYHTLRKVRDALTHADVGLCQVGETTGLVTYWNNSIKMNENECFSIKDVFGQIESFKHAVNRFHRGIFHELNTTLKNDEVGKICGFFEGRTYTRFVRPLEVIDFNSGRCDAMTWFEKEGNPRCPFADKCGAYKRAKEIQSA